MTGKASQQRGFSLLEVMIALAIVAIALVSLLGLANRSIGLNGHLQRLTQATLLAQQRMTEIEHASERGTLSADAEEGAFEEPFADYRWRTLYEDTMLASVKMVTVVVAWGDEARNERVDVTSFVFQ